ncbi:hypothetical protein AGLY_004046 [Aphis glycines]|uniref:Uncharacterized protein n=1 Tax=Aphis glycines TaxID=307491 RepID=A0A6G0TXV4_APHGL|nr:hypothetical protein AGLY_004046 [Aphis glycines]
MVLHLTFTNITKYNLNIIAYIQYRTAQKAGHFYQNLLAKSNSAYKEEEINCLKISNSLINQLLKIIINNAHLRLLLAPDGRMFLSALLSLLLLALSIKFTRLICVSWLRLKIRVSLIKCNGSRQWYDDVLFFYGRFLVSLFNHITFWSYHCGLVSTTDTGFCASTQTVELLINFCCFSTTGFVAFLFGVLQLFGTSDCIMLKELNLTNRSWARILGTIISFGVDFCDSFFIK